MKNDYLAEARALIVILIFFTLFFWPTTLAGRFFVTGDAIVYSYPLRTVAWDAIRHGVLPFWTPTLLAGYPLLSMAQVAIGYPLTWFYLFLPGYLAEQIYILAPFLLAPAFLYAFARTVGRSRIASLLAGLSFGYGGMMAGGIAHNGMFANAVMWLPLMLIAIERARSGRFLPCLIGASLAYAMSVLSGLGQGFVYAGVIALLFAVFSSIAPASDESGVLRGQRRLSDLKSWRPLAVCVAGMVLAAGVAAFQLSETLHAQRLSIRRELTYEIFSGGSFTLAEAFKSFIAPIYHFNYEVSTYLSPLAGVAAILAVFTAIRAPRANLPVLFWLGVAVLAILLMMGDHTPFYRLAFRIPVFNLFRIPWRHAFEWSFAVAILAAYGWDAMIADCGLRIAGLRSKVAILDRKSAIRNPQSAIRIKLINPLIGGLLLIACLAMLLILMKLGIKSHDAAQHEGISETAWLIWKMGYTLLLLLAVWWGMRRLDAAWQKVFLSLTVGLACFWEPFIMISNWWLRDAKPASYFNQISPPSRFLQNYSQEQNRIYTSVASGFILDLPRAEPHNISARRGFHNAAGYEPLMSERYNKAFGSGWSFGTPAFSSPADRQILSPRWQVLDLLNVRFLAEFAAPPSTFAEKEGVRFSFADVNLELPSGESVVFNGSGTPVDSLSLVTTMANSGHLAQGEKAARILIHTADGRTIERELKAGVDSAEWAHERGDVKPVIRHSLARIFDSRPGDNQNTFPSYRYWTRIDLGAKALVDRVEITCVAEKASVAIWKAALYDSTGEGVYPMSQALPEQWRMIYNHDNVQIYENRRVLPRLWLVPAAKAVSAEESLRYVRGESAESFNPREVALLELPEGVKVELPQSKESLNGEARIVSNQSNTLVIETNADKPSVLVVSESYYPGWEASIDGRQSTIFQANYLLRGMILSEGKHLVEMRYTAPAARVGLIISGLSLLLIFVVLVIGK